MTDFALPVDGVIATNRRLIKTEYNVLDRGKLEGALAHPHGSNFGQAYYPTVIQRGAALLRGLAAAHAFVDGNKRTAWISCNVYLRYFRSPLQKVPDDEATEFVVAVVVEHQQVDTIAEWLVERLS